MTQALEILLGELQSQRLEVGLVPARHPRHETHFVRVALSRNPAWYRKLCASFLSARGSRRGLPDTRIRRQDIERVLSRLASGRPTRSKYARPLLKFAGVLS